MKADSVPITPPSEQLGPPTSSSNQTDIPIFPPTQRVPIGTTNQTCQSHTSTEPPQLSKEYLNHMGMRVPENTKHQNQYSLRAFFRFVTEYPGLTEQAFKTKEHLRSCIMDGPERKMRWQLEQARKHVFPGSGHFQHLPPDHVDSDAEQLKRVRHFVIEFVVNYRSSKTASEIKPSSMKAYILGLQRAFSKIWGYKLRILEGPTFNCPNEGRLAVIDNRLSLQQANGTFTESHNVLSHKDIEKLYKSPDLAREKLKSFLARLVFDVALVTALRPSALVNLTVTQFTKLNLRGEMVWRNRQTVGSRSGFSKTNSGGWKFAGEKPVEVFVWDRPALSGLLNVLEDIDDYRSLRTHVSVGSDRFFLGYKASGVQMSDFFKNQHLGRNTVSKIAENVCASTEVFGTGSKRGMTTHGLRGTVTTLLVEAGHFDSTIVMRTGHRDPKSLKNYHNIQKWEKKRHQRNLLGDAAKGSKRSSTLADNPENTQDKKV